MDGCSVMGVCRCVGGFFIDFIICTCHSSVHEIILPSFYFFILHFLSSFATADADEDPALFSSILTPKVVEKGIELFLNGCKEFG